MDPTAPRRGDGRLRPAECARDLGVALALTAAVMGLLLASGGIWQHVGGGDLHGMFLPRYEYAARALVHEHRLPLWNAFEFCGMPLLGAAQGAVLYPPVVLAFAWLSPWTALQVLYGAHVLLLSWGMLAYLGTLGLSRAAAALGTAVVLVGVFRGPALAGVDHPSFLAGVAWLPVLLLCGARGVGESVGTPARLRWVAGFGLASASQWLAGYPEFAMDGLVVAGVATLAAGWRTPGRAIAVVGAGATAGVLLAAVQILALVDAVTESGRAALQPVLAAIHAHARPTPAGLAQRVLHHGWLAIGLAAIGTWRPSRFAVGWMIGAVWALAALVPPFGWLYRLPPFSTVLIPWAWPYVFSVLLGCLAAAGFERLRASGPGRWAAVAVAVVLLAQAGVVVARAAGSSRRPAPDYTVAERRAAAELAILATHDGFRLLSPSDIAAGVPLRRELPSASGYEPAIPPHRVVQLLTQLGAYAADGLAPAYWRGVAARPALAALLGVGVMVVPPRALPLAASAGFAAAGEVAPGAIAVVRPPVPRARLVHRLVRASSEDAGLRQVVALAGEAAAVTVLEGGGALPPASAPAPGAAESTRVVVDEPEHVEVEVTAAAPGVVVLRDTFDPGWRARVDGVATTVLRADHAFRGVAVPAGRHRVSFRYAPLARRLGAPVSGLMLLLVAAVLVGGLPRVRAGTAQRDSRIVS